MTTDEAKGMSKQAQLAIVVKYVDKEGIINERLLTFVQASSLKAESLSKGLNPTCIVSQGYDRA